MHALSMIEISQYNALSFEKQSYVIPAKTEITQLLFCVTSVNNNYFIRINRFVETKDPASKRYRYTPLERLGVTLLVLNGTV